MQVANGHGGRAADASGAMEINGVAFGEQLIQGSDAIVELGPQFDLFLDHRSTTKDDGAKLVVRLQGRKIQIDRTHVVVGMDIEHGGYGRFAAEALDIFDGARMRADEEPRKDLRVGEFFARESTHF